MKPITLFIIAVLGSGCGVAGQDTTSGTADCGDAGACGSPGCTPGYNRSCVCTDDAQYLGGQVCAKDGLSFGACMGCPVPDGGGGTPFKTANVYEEPCVPGDAQQQQAGWTGLATHPVDGSLEQLAMVLVVGPGYDPIAKDLGYTLRFSSVVFLQENGASLLVKCDPSQGPIRFIHPASMTSSPAPQTYP